MWKILLKALFKSTHRPKPRVYRKPVEETRVLQAALEETPPSAQPHMSQSDVVEQGETFDDAQARPVAPPRVLEGPAYVTDGDTITIRKTQIRLFGIDAPELHHPFGKKAKWAMIRLCKGQIIRAEMTEEDVYGRAVATCFLPDGRDLSAELVKQGLAIDWPKFSGGKYSDLEVEGVRKKLWLAEARQKGRMSVWEKFDALKEAERRP
ncbi:thermonuclease family protein [Thioclava sp. GXIMD4216]|uniref:thermonuclease family protein n=1 Tax=Thioclava sp. GXIMD4216 TaxID=3131929 RepID=UPI0030CF3B1C